MRATELITFDGWSMKQILFVFACCLALAAQQTKDKDQKMEYCGLSSSHDCHCIRHSHAVQDAYSETCRLNSKTDKEMQECLSRPPSHCSIVERSDAGGDGDGDETGEQDSGMSERCAMMCKKHDCLCDDGPRCHIGHDASEHDQNKKTAK
jgi:hypothetical protein